MFCFLSTYNTLISSFEWYNRLNSAFPLNAVKAGYFVPRSVNIVFTPVAAVAVRPFTVTFIGPVAASAGTFTYKLVALALTIIPFTALDVKVANST